MSKDITESILLKAGFIERGGFFEYSTEADKRKRTIIAVLNDSAMYSRDNTLIVYNGNKDLIGYACIQTIDHFNKLMELMDIDFRLNEE